MGGSKGKRKACPYMGAERMLAEMTEAVGLEGVKPASVWRMQYRGLVRLRLFFTGQTHELLNSLGDEARKALAKAAGADGMLDGLGFYNAKRSLDDLWAETFKEWKRQFEVLQSEAAAIAYGGLCALHERYVRPAVNRGLEELTDRRGFAEQGGGTTDPFERMVRNVIAAAERRIHVDGITLSQRVWRLDQASRAGIEQVLAAGVASGKSAWDMAKELEMYLGAGADCPRWTSTRLRLTKKEIASGDLRGLKSGEECRGQGVAYKALRLARNEYQIIHGMATDDVMAALPFVEKEQINLSPSHPEQDICDSVIASGENGQGIYPKGTVSLPIHVQCLCFKTAVLMKPEEFANRLAGWREGSRAWPAMDSYNDMVGGDVGISLAGTPVLVSLLRWSSGTYGGMLRAVTGR